MKKFLALILALVMCFSLVACGGDKKDDEAAKPSESAKPSQSTAPAPSGAGSQVQVEKDEAKTYKEEVVIGYASDVFTAEPGQDSGTQYDLLTNMTFRRLGFYNQITGEIEPVLATEWKQMDNEGKVWHIKLREGVKDHIGGTLGADDVIFTFERVIDGTQVKAPNSVLAGAYESSKAVDDLTVELVLNKPIFDAPNLLCGVKVYSKDAFDQKIENPGYVSYGPYKWGGQEIGVKYWVDAFEDYFEGERPTKRITFKVMPEIASQLAALQAGEINVSTAITANDIDTIVADDPNVTSTEPVPGATIHFLAWNGRRDIANNKAVTDAIAKAIDKESVMSVFTNDNGFVINNMVGNAASPDYCEVADVYTYDPEAAKAELAAAGYDEGELELTLMYYAYHKPIHEVVQACLMDIGVKVVMREIDGSVYRAMCEEGEFDITSTYCGLGAAVNHMTNRFFKADGAGNWFGYVPTQEIADQFAVCEAQTNMDDLLKEAHKLQELCAADTRYVPLFTGVVRYCHTADLQGTPLYAASSFADFSTLYIEE